MPAVVVEGGSRLRRRRRRRQVEVGEAAGLPGLDVVADRGVGQRAAAELRDVGQRLAAGEGRVEGRVEALSRRQRQEAVLPRPQEVLEERALRRHLVVVDAAPDAASERAHVARLDRHVEADLALDAQVELVHPRLGDLAVDTEGRRGEAQPDLLGVGARHLEDRGRHDGRAGAHGGVLVAQQRRRGEARVADRRVARDGDRLLVDEGQGVGAAHRGPAVLARIPGEADGRPEVVPVRACTSRR